MGVGHHGAHFENLTMSFQLRFDESKGVYRDCKWCGGEGCLACPGEADKEYNRQFPDGPKPMLTITTEQMENPEILNMLKSLISPDAIMSAKDEGEARAKAVLESPAGRAVELPSGMTKQEAIAAIAVNYTGQILEERIEASGIKQKLESTKS